MGFFAKLKQNLKHGGVSISLDAPASVSFSDGSFPVTVSVTASDSTQQVGTVQVRVTAEQIQTGNNPNGPRTSTAQTIATAQDTTGFSLQPGQTQSVSLTVALNGTDHLHTGSVVGQALQSAELLSERFSGSNYTYTVHASADVAGIALDPSCSQPIQILKPGQIGTAVNFKL